MSKAEEADDSFATDTAEAEELMSVEQAKSLLQAIHDAPQYPVELVLEAYRRKAWDVLGYPRWADFAADQLKSFRASRYDPERDGIVKELRAAGLTQREVARTLNVSQSTVARLGDISNTAPARPVPEKHTPRPTPGRPGRATSSRRPMRDEFMTVLRLSMRDLDRITRLIDDRKRWRENREDLAVSFTSDVERLHAILTRLLDEFSDARTSTDL